MEPGKPLSLKVMIGSCSASGVWVGGYTPCLRFRRVPCGHCSMLLPLEAEV